MTYDRKQCGLCGKTKRLIKTICCDNWICNDAHEYVPFSYNTNSCYRNHDRYTLCAYHHRGKHAGGWQNCRECKQEIQLERYVDFGTNNFNFEKLQDVPEVIIKCINCEFESNSIEDFAFRTSRGWFCTKVKCQKAAMSI